MIADILRQPYQKNQFSSTNFGDDFFYIPWVRRNFFRFFRAFWVEIGCMTVVIPKITLFLQCSNNNAVFVLNCTNNMRFSKKTHQTFSLGNYHSVSMDMLIFLFILFSAHFFLQRATNQWIEKIAFRRMRDFVPEGSKKSEKIPGYPGDVGKVISKVCRRKLVILIRLAYNVCYQKVAILLWFPDSFYPLQGA